MKKQILFLLLLSAFLLSSCNSNLPGKEAKEELAYQGAPNEYKLILDDFRLFSEHMRSDQPFDDDFEKIGFLEYPYSSDQELAYAVIDINKDEIPELLLGTMEGLQKAAPNAIFTLKDGDPVLLTSFWSRNTGVLAADGTIYNIGSGGASHTYLWSFVLDKKADTLTQLTDIHSDYAVYEEKPFYIQVVGDQDHNITEEEFWDFYEEYDNPPEKMELTIIPINGESK